MLLIKCLDCGEELLSYSALSSYAVCPMCSGQRFVITVYQKQQYYEYAIDLDMVNEYNIKHLRGGSFEG